MGAGEVAAVDSVQVLALKAAAEPCQLKVALGRNGAVVLTMSHAEEVALRLSVADEENLCCRASFLFTGFIRRSLYLRPIIYDNAAIGK